METSNLFEIVENAISKAGLTDKMKPILENEEVKKLSNIQVETETKNLFLQNLMNLDSAKSNPQISAHYKQSYFGTIDSEITTKMRELGFNENTILEIQKENTTSKIGKSLQKAIEKAKADTQKEGKANESESILNLQKALEAEKTKGVSEIQSLKQMIENLQSENSKVRKDYILDAQFDTFSYREDLNKEHIKVILKTELERELAQKRAKIVIIDNVPYLKNADNETLDFFDAQKGQVVKFKDFLEEVVANSKMLKVAGGTVPPQNNNQNPQNNNNSFNLPTPQKRAGVEHLRNKLNGKL